MESLTAKERALFQKLSTPAKIQDFLDRLPRNFEKEGDTLHSPRMVLRHRKAHCFEGALFAAAILGFHQKDAILLDLVADKRHDDSHVVTLYRQNGYWGAIAKSNHASLGFRDPIYTTPREVALTYFHEYFNDAGIKTLRSYGLLDSRKLKEGWVTAEEPLLHFHKLLDALPHTPFVPKENKRHIRRANALERRAGRLLAWKRNDPRT
jgi:hypothetical protein